LDECRGKLDYYEQQAGDRCGSSTYKSGSQRVPKGKRYLTGGGARDAVEGISSQQTFKVTTFHVIIDHLKSALDKRIEAYSLVLQIFGLLTEYESTSDEDLMLLMLSQDLLVCIRRTCHPISQQNFVNVHARSKSKDTMK